VVSHISVTSYFTEIFERVLREKLVTVLEGDNLLNANQHGFLAKWSYPPQQLETYDTILNLVEEGKLLMLYILTLQKHFIMSIIGSYVINLNS